MRNKSSIIFCVLGMLTGQISNAQPLLSHTLTGEGKITLLFLHGWCIDRTYWDNQVNYLKNDYQVLCVDLANHGNSKHIRNDCQMASYADDVVKLIKAKKLNNIVLIGHSMSGNIILRIQRKVPKRIIGFIGIDNFLEVGSLLTPKQEQETADFFKKFELEYPKVATDFCNSYLFCAQTDTLIKQRVINDVLKSDPNRAIETLRSLFKEGAYERRAFGKMKLKTYLIVSDYHRIQENTLKQYIKSGYDIRYVTNSGHYPMIEQPQQLNERLREILAEIRPK